jgi:hypothetical protein
MGYESLNDTLLPLFNPPTCFVGRLAKEWEYDC